MLTTRQFARMVANEERKLLVEIQRGARRPRRFLPLRETMQDKRWSLGRNRYRSYR